MQHYSLPTRLLDWTSDPLVALAMALKVHEPENNNNDSDAVIWLLDPIALNACNNHITVEKEYIPNICMIKDDSLNPYLSDKYRASYNKILPLALIGPLNNDRIAQQKGKFTIFPILNSSCTFEGYSNEIFSDDKRYIEKIIIDKNSKSIMREHLIQIGYNNERLFP